MSEENRPAEGEQTPSWEPASIYKRVWAWTGVVYMVIIVILLTYSIATMSYLKGIAGIMIFPALAGFAVNKGIQSVKLGNDPEAVIARVWCIAAGIAAAAALIWGIVQVVSLFG